MTPVAIGQPLQPVPAEPQVGNSGEEAEVGLTEPGLQLDMMSAARATPFPPKLLLF